MGTWVIDIPYGWVAMLLHTGMKMADGHSENHRFTDPETLKNNRAQLKEEGAIAGLKASPLWEYCSRVLSPLSLSI